MEGRPKVNHEKEHKAANIRYRKAILRAIEQLHDFQSRSNVDAIRKHVQASLEANHLWNDAVFMKTLKSVVQDGEIEQCTTLNCALSPEYKRKRADSLSAILERRISSGVCSSSSPPPHLPTSPPHISISIDYVSQNGIKIPPKRKAEHEKWKIIPKKVYDKTIIVNPMDTH